MQETRGRKPLTHNNRIAKDSLLPCKNLKTACGVFEHIKGII
jgi:hypothetical protein